MSDCNQFTLAEINVTLTNTENMYQRLLARYDYLKNSDSNGNLPEIEKLELQLERIENLLCLLYAELYELANEHVMKVENALFSTTTDDDGLQ